VRIWFLSNLARYVPGNVWSFVGAVELARREGVARRTTLAVMALNQALAVGMALAVGLPVLVAEHARLGRAAGAGLALLAGGVAVAALLWRPLLRLARRRYPDLRLKDLLPSPPVAAGLALGYGLYWVVTGLAFTALVRGLVHVGAGEVPLLVAGYAAAYAVGFLSIITPAGIGVREGVLVAALTGTLGLGPATLVAVVSRVWMMLVEAGCAIVAAVAGRRSLSR
jgi:hypothetical protein